MHLTDSTGNIIAENEGRIRVDGVKHLQVRLTDDEHAKLQRISGHVPLQRFVRSYILQAMSDPGRAQPNAVSTEGLSSAQKEIIEGAVEILRKGKNTNAIAALTAVVRLSRRPSQP